MTFYNQSRLGLKAERSHVLFHTDTALMCIVFLAASLKTQVLSAKKQ